ncbi:hypothetical protein [Oceanobacillus manasiensis]|uniref:hypothetical protein n=1 Tax=Oceanobacillus manasiensis TaxID=586413 RepID=UPI0005A615AE|nr:hypothetical protein [Oceanobacillus manasiensis]
MSKTITKIFLHPVFRFFIFLVATVWLTMMGIAESGFFRWVDFILAFILLGAAIENGVRSVAYFQRDQHG